MKKVILGVVALCVAMSSAWGVCERERKQYAYCLKAVAVYESGGDWGTEGSHKCINGGLRKAKMELEACLIEKGRY